MQRRKGRAIILPKNNAWSTAVKVSDKNAWECGC
nr:MAG TPA: hypothetical protein [Bacteriophage sp.]